MRLSRRSPSRVTRWKISRALRGRKKPPETVERIRAAQEGRVFSERHKELLRQAQAERRLREASMTPIELCRAIAQERRRAEDQERFTQRDIDMMEAARMGDRALLLDVKKSYGYANKRKIHDPTGRVSDGWTSSRKRYRFPGGGSYGIRKYKNRRTGLGRPLIAPNHDLRECKPEKKAPFWINKQKGLAEKPTTE